jgi:DnaJ-class molecular chaperone
LEDLYNGKTAKIELERSVVCKGCSGAGGKSSNTCAKCKGNGFVMQFKQIGPGMVQQMQSQCKECHGEGEIIHDKCKTCSGRKTVKEKKQFEVPVDKGMNDGQKITFTGESNQEVISAN